MDNKVITVSGFAFENPTVGEEALKEQEAIEYVNNQLNFNDKQSLLTLYNQMVRRRMFHTEVGYAYLKSIQDYLMKTDIDPADIESIPVNIDYNIKADEGSEADVKAGQNKAADKNKDSTGKSDTNTDIKARQREIKLKNKLKRYQRLTVTFITVAVVLAATVVAMFVIASTSDNPTILNYEEVLQNKYAAWEQDLEAREAALKNSKN